MWRLRLFVLGAAVECRTKLWPPLAGARASVRDGFTRATGDTSEAIRHLERAISLNARFNPSQPPIARRVLDSLRAVRPRATAMSVSASRP